VTGASAPAVAAVTEDAAPVTVAELTAGVAGLTAVEVAGEVTDVAEVTGEVTAEVAELTGEVTAGVAGLTAVEVAGEVTAEVAGLTGEVTGMTAGEVTGEVAELTVEVTGEVAGLTGEVAVEVAGDVAVETGDVAVELVVAEVTAEVTGDVAELTGEVTAERDDVGDGVSEVAARACRENRNMITNIPAATIASCTARRAMRRTIGCGMSSSHPPGNRTRCACPLPGVSITRTQAKLSRPQTGHAVRSPPYSAVAGSGKMNRTATESLPYRCPIPAILDWGCGPQPQSSAMRGS
jgi:hypothetical protein